MNDRPGHQEHMLTGMIAAAGAMFLFAIMNGLAKHLSETHSVIEIAFWRNLFASLPFLGVVFVAGRRDLLKVHSAPRLLVIRAVMGSVTLTVTFAAFSVMPMAETSVLLFTASLFLPILGVIFLKEGVGPWRWSAVVIGFLGVGVMANPAGSVNTLGVSLALGAALLQATMGILLRRLGSYERPETIALYFFVIGTCMTGLAMPYVGTGPTLAELPFFVALGFVGAGAQWSLSLAYKHAPTAIVAVFNYTSLIWATLIGWLFWEEWPLPVVFVGSAIVIAANMLIIWRENRRSNPAR